MPTKKRILVLTANPIDSRRLRLDEEIKKIKESIKISRHRSGLDFRSEMAVSAKDLRQAMLEFEPHIVHFSGHGTEEGIFLEDEAGQAKLATGEALAGLFKLFPSVECVLLNACYSEPQAQAIVQHVPYVIGMIIKIGDKNAIAFSGGFYDGIGNARDYEFSYQLGISAIQFEDSKSIDHLIPILKKSTNQEPDNGINDPRSIPKNDLCPPPSTQLPFKNREEELGEICKKSSHVFIMIDAPAGYGKTHLLYKIKDNYIERGWKCFCVDLKQCATADDCLKEVLQLLSQQADCSNEVSRARLKTEFSKCNTILLFDNGHLLETKQLAELINTFVYWKEYIKHGTFRVIIAGRYLSNKNKRLWRKGPGFSPIHLSPLSKNIVEKLLTAISNEKSPNAESTQISKLAELVEKISCGHPRSICNLVQHFKNNHWEVSDNSDELFNKYVRPELDTMLKDLSDGAKAAFEILCVFRKIGIETIGKLRDQPEFSKIHASDLEFFNQLGMITEDSDTGRYTDGLLRKLSLAGLQQNRLLEIHKIAQEIYQQQLSSGNIPVDYCKFYIKEIIYHALSQEIGEQIFFSLLKELQTYLPPEQNSLQYIDNVLADDAEIDDLLNARKINILSLCKKLD